MRILKCITTNYRRSEPCPFRNGIMIGNRECIKCEYFRGNIRRDGTVAGEYGDGKPLMLFNVNIIGANRTPGCPRDSENVWWYMRCNHPTD